MTLEEIKAKMQEHIANSQEAIELAKQKVEQLKADQQQSENK